VTTSQLPRRAIVGTVLATALIGGGLVTAFADDAPAAGGPCPTWTDPKGDATTGQGDVPQTGDDQMDILSSSLTNDGANVVATISDVKMGDTASDAGDKFKISFLLGGKQIEVFSTRGGSLGDPLTSPVGFAAGFSNTTDKTTGVATAKYDTKASKLTITGTVAELSKALGSDATGKVATGLVSQSQDYIPNVGGFVYDDSVTKLTFTVGANCAGGATTPVAAAPAPSASPSAEPTPSPSAAPPAAGAPVAGLPAADCFTAKDPKGDAKYNGQTVSQSPNDPDMDILGLTLGTTADSLVGYFKVDKLAAGPASLDGHRFAVNFTFNKHNFTASGSAFKDAPAGQLRDGLSASGRIGKVTQLAVDGGPTIPTDAAGAQAAVAGPGFVESKLKYTFDVKTSMVSMSLPLADIEKYGKAPTAGATFSAVFATASADSSTLSFPFDTVPDGGSATASKLTYTVGDNHCFAPPVPPLSSVGALKAQYGDTAAVAAKLVDAAGAAVAGKTVTFTLGASKATGVTGADGVAKAALIVQEKAGKRSLVISTDDANVSVDFTVSVEKTALKAVGSKGAVTATLTDDDKKPVVGQVITFTSGSKKVTAKTDAKGVAKASGLPAGNIKVSYAGATGMYTAASATTKA
jgi:hypothetical protein